LEKKFIEALKLFASGSIGDLTVEEDCVSATVIGEEGNYLSIISLEGFVCSCTGQSVHKSICKHLLALAFETIVSNPPRRLRECLKNMIKEAIR